MPKFVHLLIITTLTLTISTHSFGSTASNRDEIGKASDYPPIDADPEHLASNMKARRKHSWEMFRRVTKPVRFVDGMLIPRFQTWYDRSEFQTIFKILWSELTEEQRIQRVSFSNEAIDRVFLHQLEKRDPQRWLTKLLTPEEDPLDTPLFHIGGKNPSRTLFSPEFIRHYLEHYAEVENCSTSFVRRFPRDFIPPDPENFTLCFSKEFPKDAVMLKMVWAGKTSRVFDSDADTMKETLERGALGGWLAARNVDLSKRGDSEIYSIVYRNSKRYLMAMHVVTKEVREWVWGTFWWSDDPYTDLGSDKPFTLLLSGLPWLNYKMCVSSAFEEKDRDPGRHYRWFQPDLKQTLKTVHSVMGSATWCANPYLEGGFPKSNCLGCHQSAGGFGGGAFLPKRRVTIFPQILPFLSVVSAERLSAQCENHGRATRSYRL